MRNHRMLLPPLLVLVLVMLMLAATLAASHPHNDADDGPNVTIAYTFWNERLPPYPSSSYSSDTSKDTTNYTLVLMTCFHDGSTPKTPAVNMALTCCHAMARGASSASISAFVSSKGMDPETCRQEGSMVPPLKFNNKTAVVTTNHQFMWYAGSSQEPIIRGLGPETTRRTFIWNDREKSGVWMPLENSDSDSDSDSQYINDWISSNLFPALGTGDSKISIHLDTSLSQAGGMHRSLHHHLTLPLSQKDVLLWETTDDHPTKNLQHLQLKATFLLLIPSDMFLDAEDAFDPHRFRVELLQNKNDQVILSDQKYNYSLSLESERIIDIEQPAFASPQHAVVIHLEWNATAASIVNAVHQHPKTVTSSLAIHFTTKIHLRYPSPVSSASAKASSLYQPVLMMPPRWMHGVLSLVFDDNYNDNDGRTDFLLVPNHGATIPGLLVSVLSDYSNAIDGEQQHRHSDYKSPHLLTTWVASAVKEDFVWVASFTVLCSIVGAVLLGYETFKISTLSSS